MPYMALILKVLTQQVPVYLVGIIRDLVLVNHKPSIMSKMLYLNMGITCVALFLFVSIPGLGQGSKPAVLFSQQKTPCYGYCPTYELTVFEDGSVIFFGEAHIEPLGKHVSRLNELELLSFKKEFEKIRFFELEDNYYKEVSDLSTTYVYYKDGLREKKIMDYYGAPIELKALERKIEELIGKLAWQAIKED